MSSPSIHGKSERSSVALHLINGCIQSSPPTIMPRGTSCTRACVGGCLLADGRKSIAQERVLAIDQQRMQCHSHRNECLASTSSDCITSRAPMPTATRGWLTGCVSGEHARCAARFELLSQALMAIAEHTRREHAQPVRQTPPPHHIRAHASPTPL